MYTLKIMLGVTGAVLIADFVGAISWIASGQVPEGIYIGMITINIIKIII